MDQSTRSSATLFDVYLRLRPSITEESNRYMDVEPADTDNWPKYITTRPPANDPRKRAVEKFAFTRVFEENASQLDIFQNTGVLSLVEGVLGYDGKPRDGLLATLGVTGSGKSHTILGSKSQRGLTQLALDVLFQSISNNIVHPTCANSVFPSLAASDVSEAQMIPATYFLDPTGGDGASTRGSCSRAQTPMPVSYHPSLDYDRASLAASGKSDLYPDLPGVVSRLMPSAMTSRSPVFASVTRPAANVFKDASFLSIPATSSKQRLPRISNMAQSPSVDGFQFSVDSATEYAIVVSMYQVYNDRIFDLLAAQASHAKHGPASKPRPLLFKSTSRSGELKVVAGLRKVVCCNLEEALMVLESGRLARKVAETGSNATSSRSHCFFCVEVKKRNRVEKGRWEATSLTIVDLAGSERARQAKTAGATLAEAGKINESLMYLGQCMQLQNDHHDGHKNVVPYRQCKLTELLFSNSFNVPSPGSTLYNSTPRNPQRAVMIVTADPTGDYNATSQILRYSALAREVTVPRIPSITSQILASVNSARPGSRDGNSGRDSPSVAAYQEEILAQEQEISRLTDELDLLSLQLEEEKTGRKIAEDCWSSARDQLQEMQDVEQEVREECYEEMVNAVAKERNLWQQTMEAENEFNEERLDAKVDILSRSVGELEIHEDEDAKVPNSTLTAAQRENEDLRDENRRLLARLANMEREQNLRTPSATMKKQRVLKSRKWEVQDENSELA